MKISPDHNEFARGASAPMEQEATKEDPYQPPWVKKLRQILGLLVFGVLAVCFYNLFAAVGPRIQPAVESTKSFLEQEQRSAASRVAAADAAEKQRRQNPASPSAVRVFARALSGAPGAIICGDYQSVILMFSLYNRHLEDRLEDAITKGLSRSIRGESPGEPDPALFGCALIPDGRAMMKEPTGILPVVSAQLDDGTYIKGITMPPMIRQ